LNKREKKIDALRLDHLNSEERIHVEELIKKGSEKASCFYLSGENLEHTNILQHRIPTINEIPIHTRQYRFPAIHKDEINKQVNELLDQNIIKLSRSPYNMPVWIVLKKPDSKGNK